MGAPSRPYARYRPATLFGVYVGQIITWQLTVVAVLLAVQQPLWALIPVALLALLLLILTMVPRHDRWLFQWLVLWVRYATRRRRRPVPDTDEGALGALLRTVTRGGRIEALDIDGASVALITHAGGLTALLAPVPSDSSLIVESSEMILPLTVLLPLGEAGEPVVSAQVVVHSVPAPIQTGENHVAAASYRELGNALVPSQRRYWVALQALRTTDDHTDDDLRGALVRAVHRLQRRLRKTGLRGHPLSPDEAVADFLALARLRPVPRGADRGAAAIQEHWCAWSAGPDLQTTFRLVDWPDLFAANPRNFLNWLLAVPTLATTVAVAVRRTGEVLELEAAVRMALPDVEAITRATAQLEEIAGWAGARVQRVDGEQVFGLAASLPLGGFLA